MHGALPASVISYLNPSLSKSCSYILDNFTREWGISLYNIFENAIFHHTIFNPEFSHHLESLQTVFSLTSKALVLYDAHTLALHLTKQGTPAQYLKLLTAVASLSAIAYRANKTINHWFPNEQKDPNILTLEIPESKKQNVDVTLIRPTTGSLQILYLSRILLSVSLAFATTHKIPYAINTICQINTLFRGVLKISLLKFSRKISYLTLAECRERMVNLTPIQRLLAEFWLPQGSSQLPEEEFEKLLNRTLQISPEDEIDTFVNILQQMPNQDEFEAFLSRLIQMSTPDQFEAFAIRLNQRLQQINHDGEPAE